jgi:hypothetical protein
VRLFAALRRGSAGSRRAGPGGFRAENSRAIAIAIAIATAIAIAIAIAIAEDGRVLDDSKFSASGLCCLL